MASLLVFPLALVWLLSIFTAKCSLLLGTSNETENDRQALLCFKSQLSDPADAFASWSSTSLELCTWHGITCSTQSPRRVTELNLASEGIMGSIPPCIANLTSLRKLQLSNNSLHGSIPAELGLLSQLSNLNLSMNSLEGNIPAQLSSCSQLQILGLWNNSLHSEIPPSLGQCVHLQEINLSNNKLQRSIPSAFGNLPELQILVLAQNKLDGPIPPSLGINLSLKYVDLGRNALTGGIPESLANSSSLQVLRLMSNSLSGDLPKALFKTLSLTAICLQQNHFLGSIPPITSTSPPVKYLYLAENHLSGAMHPTLGNLSALLSLHLEYNNLVGSIPESLSHITTLETLDLNNNNLSGPVPQSLFNMSSLEYLAVANNSLIGQLPLDIGYTLPGIRWLTITANKFEGTIPASLLNAYNLEILELANNSFTGFIPFFGSLPNLRVLDLGNNKLDAGDWSFISSLSNCSKLTELRLDGNNLQGNFPSSFGNLSGSIQSLWLSYNNISGSIPPGIGNLKNLNELIMRYNSFTGTIPSTIGNLHSLVRLGLEHNKLSGQIPDTIGNLARLTDLTFGMNNLSGRIPATIGHCNLRILNLAQNSLDGTIPGSILKISSLVELNLSHNYLSGGIPEGIGSLINLEKLSVSHNTLSGNIPPNFGKCVVLEYLEMQNNNFVGSIPQAFANLVSIKDIDMSQNNLSGDIPEFFASLKYLQHLDVSFNNFEGAVPRGGIFDSAGAVSMEGNNHLCASIPTGGMTLCSASIDKKTEYKILVLALEILIPIVAAVVITFSCLAVINWRSRKQVRPHLPKFTKSMKKLTYRDIVNATDRFSSVNLIGSGSFGVVYRGNLNFQEHKVVAIKVFNLDIYGAYSTFVAECESLRNARHRNLVKIITACSSEDYTGADFKALVLQYMPNGSLEMWLHPKAHEYSNGKILTLSQRIAIALDVASALDYLHNQCASPLIHCDLKPSNILLDHNMTAYVSDFGLARFLNTRNADQDCSASLACLKGSIGYIPPEYGMSEQISTKGDVYSFGVLLLEMITGSSPTDEEFNDSTNLHDFVHRAFPENIHEMVDPVMLQDEIDATEVMQNCIIPLARIGLSCSMTSPRERPEMGQVCADILTIKHTLSNWQGK